MADQSPSYRIGVDLGGTKTESILLSATGDELFRKRLPTPRQSGYRAIIENIAALVEETRSQIPGNAACTLGLGIPGVLDRELGTVQNANTTELIDHSLGADLEELIGQPIAIENDANCFTMAECRAGAARGYDLVFGVIMGTGCGGGLFINGRVRTGPHGIAGEWGHVSIDPAGPPWWSGIPGPVESKISGSGVEAAYERRFGEKRKMQDIVDAYRQGENKAGEVFRQFLDDYGRALAMIVNILDPDAIVLGGGLSNIQELYEEGDRLVRRYAFHRSLRTPILKNQLGDSAGVFGAAWIGH